MQSQVETQNTEAYACHIFTGLGVIYSQEPFTKLSLETGIYPICLTEGRAEGNIIVEILQHGSFSKQPSVYLQVPSDQHQ